VFKDQKFSLDLRAGPAYVYEQFFSGSSNSNASLLAGLRAVYTFNERMSISQDVLYTVAATTVQDYQLSGETAFNLKLPEVARGVGLKFAFRDDYDNSTSAPQKNNDTRLTLSITLDY
jgi:putative salt-induced outer membrane protein YdiY